MARGEGANGPQIGACGPNWIGLPVGTHAVSLQSNDGIGPRVLPSHSSHPIAHPLLNQKHACPFDPEMLRSSVEAACRDGNGHQGSKGRGCGTSPPQGISLESTAFLGGGYVNAEWAWAFDESRARPRTKGNFTGVVGVSILFSCNDCFLYCIELCPLHFSYEDMEV